MSRLRSPAHPDVPLQRAIEFVARLESRIRSNAVDRDTAVREMGYSGMTGASGKMLANLVHFGLVRKAGKGSVRVSPIAIDILHPKTDDDRRRALNQAFRTPVLYQEIAKEFADGIPTETWLRSFLARRSFANVAVIPAMNSYLETCQFLQQERAYESHGAPPPPPVDSSEIEELDGDDEMDTPAPDTDAAPSRRADPIPTVTRKGEPAPGAAPGERVVFTEEGAPGQYLVVKASGDVTDDMLEALEDFVRRQRKRIERLS